MVCSAQAVHLSSVKISTISKRTESTLLVVPHYPGVPSGVSKTISEPKVCLAQIMHLSCNDTNIVTELTEMRFHMTHIT
jgi:hypothetical protein